MKNNTDNFYSTASGFPIRLYSARPDNEGAVPLHRHNELELLLVREGTLRLNFSEDSLELSAGHGVLINSGVMHSLGGSADCVCTYVMFSDEFVAPAGTVLTQSVDGKRLYIHLQECQFKAFNFPTLSGKVAYMQLLNDASEVIYVDNHKAYDAAGNLEDSKLMIRTPATAYTLLAPVIEVFLK